MAARFPIILALAMLLAGCAENPTSTNVPASAPLSPIDNLPDVLLSDCLYVSIGANNPESNQETKPSPWPQEKMPLFYEIETWQCSKIALGAVEVQEAVLVIESIGGNTLPENCRELASGAWAIRSIQEIWVNNYTLASELSKTLDVPVQSLASATIEINSAPDLSEITLAGAAGLDLSRTGLYGYSPTEHDEYQHVYFWETESTVGILNWYTNEIRSDLDQQGGPGSGPERPLAPSVSPWPWGFMASIGNFRGTPEIQEDYFCGGSQS